MLGIARRQERAAEFAERRQFAVQNHFAIGEVHLLAPGRIRLPLFINGNALAQPARHAVSRGGQRDDVQNSCHSTSSQLAGFGACDAGLFAVITEPKQTPR